jgi:hypothetical protein
MKDNLPDGQQFLSSDAKSLSEDDKFELNVNIEQAGNFYLVEEAAGALNLLFPVASKSRNANPKYWTVFNAAKNQKFWLVWSKNPVSALEAGKPEMRAFLEKNFDANAVKTNVKAGKIEVSGTADLVVYRLAFN